MTTDDRIDVEALHTATAAILAALCARHPQGEAVFQAVRDGSIELLVSHSVGAGIIIVAAVRPGSLDDAQTVAEVNARTGEVRYRRFGGEPVH